MPTPPANVKKPQDRKPKDEGPAPLAGKVREVDILIDPAALDDFELLDDIGRIDAGEVFRAPGLLRRLVGDETMRALMDAARNEGTGRVSAEDGATILSEVFEVLKEQAPNS